MRDYLYIPLGGNRKGELRRNINLMITMLLGGLWHGASWNFVVWGGLHFIFLVVNQSYRKILSSLKITPPRSVLPIYWLLTFISAIVARVFFRARSFSRSLDILFGMFGGNGALLTPNLAPFPWMRSVLTSLGVEIDNPSYWALTGGKYQIFLLVVCTLAVVFLPNSYEWTCSRMQRDRFSVWWAVAIGGVLALSLCFLYRVSEFLYFQF